METVSILMPAYNAGKYIREAVVSVLAQSFTTWELVILNDGSTDDTEAIILSYTDPRIRYEKNDRNRGLVYTRNRLLELARFDLVAFLDSDDIAMPERLAVQLNYLRQHPETGLVAGSLYTLQDQQTDRKTLVFDLSPEALKAHLLFYNPVSTSSVMFRKSALPEIHFRDDYPPVEDYDLWTRMLVAAPGVVLPAVLGYYRLHEQNISKVLSSASYANRNKVVLNQLEYYFPGKYSPDDATMHLSLADLKIRNGLADVPRVADWIRKLLAWNQVSLHFDSRILGQVLYERVLKKFLRLEGYDMSVYRNLQHLKHALQPRLTWELRKKELAILAFSLAGKKFIATD